MQQLMRRRHVKRAIKLVVLLLATAELADAVGEYLPGLAHTVLDPVMVATSANILTDTAISISRRRRIP